MKVSIVGVGRVGGTIALTIVQQGIADELVLVNRTRKIAEGEALDLMHASAFAAKPISVYAGDMADTAGSDVIIMCASIPMPAKLETRDQFAVGNYALMSELIPEVARYNPQAILLMVTNPVDAMTYLAFKLSGFPASRVIGTGTLIDSARYRALLSREFTIHADDVRAYILGEHGDCQFPALSIAMTGGMNIEHFEASRRLFDVTLKGGYEVVKRKGHTNYAIAMAAILILRSIAGDWRRTMPVSCLISDYLGVDDVCLSVPAVIGRSGIVRQILPGLSEDETAAFQRAGAAVKRTLAACTAPETAAL